LVKVSQSEGTVGKAVIVGVGDSLVPGVGVKVAVASIVGVGVNPRIVRPAPIEGRSVRLLFPCETRAVHSIVVCPPRMPLASKVNTGPLVVALFPLLPAIATINTPLCGSLMAVTASAPNKLDTTMLSV